MHTVAAEYHHYTLVVATVLLHYTYIASQEEFGCVVVRKNTKHVALHKCF